MTDYLTEQEQIQQLKNWIKQYGMTILIGIFIAIAITSAFRYWEYRHQKMLRHASAIFDEMIAMRAQNNTQGTLQQARKLLEHYTKTPYADMAALMLAREAVIKNNFKEALDQLEWVIHHSKQAPIRDIARIRAARILIAEKKPDDALSLLKGIEDNSFKGLANEARGDAWLSKNDTLSAKKAYELALQELPNAEVSRPILEMKVQNLAI